jgi:hypothetical protein
MNDDTLSQIPQRTIHSIHVYRSRRIFALEAGDRTFDLSSGVIAVQSIP